jgi:hypothetical protein
VGIKNPITGKTSYVHLSRISIYSKRDDEDPLTTALKFKKWYVIEDIISHEFRPPSSRSVKNLYIKLKWKDYDGIYEENIGSNLSIRKTVQFVEYANRFPELQKFIITELEYEDDNNSKYRNNVSDLN